MRLLYVLGIFCISQTAISQDNYILTGQVLDSLQQPLIAATTVIINPADSSMITFGITNGKGEFTLPQVPPGEHALQITYVGYGTFQQKFNTRNQPRIIDLGKILLSPDNNLLEEVIVKAKHVPLVIKKDTLEYNTAAFNTRKTDAVEDLLKKLPGVEVEQDGNIKVQGEDVEKVLVDGKDFFGDDPTIATRNLPADIVNKVQVYDKKSDETEFTGIDDGQKDKTIDLQLKEDKKAGMFGNIEGGYGNDERYTGKLHLNRFSSNTQISLISNINNINNIGYSITDRIGFSGGPIQIVSGGDNTRGKGVSGVNTTATSGLNFNYDFGKKIKWRSSYFFNYADNIVTENTISENILPDLTYLSNEDTERSNDSRGHHLNARMEYDMDSTTELRIRGKINFDDQKDRLQSLINNINAESLISSANRNNLSEEDRKTYDLQAALRKRLGKKGRIFQLKSSFNKNLNDDYYEVDNTFLEGMDNFRLLQEQSGHQNSQYTNVGITYTEPLSKKTFLSFSGNMSRKKEDQVQDFFDIDPDSEVRSRNTDISDTFQKVYHTNSINSSIRKIGKNTNINFGLAYQYANLTGGREKNEIVNQNYSFILPSLYTEIDLGNGRINMNYSTRVTEPTLQQLQPIVNNRNPLLVYNGNPELIPSYNHNLYIGFNHYDPFYFRSMFAFLMMTYTKDHIATSRVVDENFVTTITPINVKDNLKINGSFSYGTPLGWIPAKIRLTFNGNLDKGLALINELENNNIRKNAGFSLRLENKKKDHFDLSVKGGVDITSTSYSVSEQYNLDYLTTSLSSSLEVYLSESMSIGTDFSMNKYSQETFSTDNINRYWNAYASKSFGEGQRLTLELEIKDILNTGAGINRNATAETISETRSSNLGRYGLLKINYSLSAFRPKPQFNVVRGD